MVAFVVWLSGAANIAEAQTRFFRTHPQSQYVEIGQTVILTVGLGGGQPSSYQWQKNGVSIPGATDVRLTLAVTNEADAGNYSIVVGDRFGSESSAPAVLYMSRIANFSVRASVGPDAPSITLGHGIAGRGSVALLRAVGPALAQFGVQNGLIDPRITVARTFPASSNDGWSNGPNAPQIADEGRRLGAFPLAAKSADAAIFSAFDGVAFSAEAGSVSNGNGIVLFELYHADLTRTNRLVNVSARARIRTRDDKLTAGFVLVGKTKTTLLIRAVGPSLAAFGVIGLISDPNLELFRVGTGEPLARNDNWGGNVDLLSAFPAVGAFPLASVDSKDAVLLVTLEPGEYSAQVAGVGSSLGEVLIEIYLLQ